MPVLVDRAKTKIPHAAQIAAMRAEIHAAKLTAQGKLINAQYITQDPFMLEQLSLVESITTMDMPVLIIGESGTGKDVIAQIIGSRYTINESTGMQEKLPYVAVNCAGITDTLFESEMFGHVRGAFTGAVGNRKGYFEAANGGTLFLDEIGDLPLHQQAKILRVLQNREVTPVGSTDTIPIKVRVVSATNKDLKEAMKAGQFREDLFYRIAKVIVRTTPLSQRPLDIIPIANAIIDRNGWTPLGKLGDPNETIPAFAYSRGNVRRLESCLQLRELGFEWDSIAEQWDW